MKIKILFDKDTEDKKLRRGWGVSFLIDDKVLFDTGEKGSWLIDNMKRLEVNRDKIEAVVISHEHCDHTAGLWELLKERRNLKVYGCSHFSQEFKKKVKNVQGRLIENTEITKVVKNIFVTGEMVNKCIPKYVFEQALFVKTNRGISVFTGCSHPGIIKILEEVREKFSQEKIYLVLGGFHLMDEDKRVIELIVDKFKKLGVEKVGPTHCSGYEARELFRRQYQDNFLETKVGKIVEV